MSFSPFNWIRDILGIRKDIIEVRKTQAELRKLNDEEIARHLLNTATLEDILKYDVNTKKLIEEIAKHSFDRYDSETLSCRAYPPRIVYRTIYHNIEQYIYFRTIRMIEEEEHRLRKHF